MLELGSYAIEHHGQISDLCEKNNIDQIFLCGSHVLKQAFSSLSDTKISASVDQSKDLIPLVINTLQNNDVILVKGSKGSKVSLVAEALIKASER
jgi:UDP-N-acetylmuramoyl-tripeptide--D-alanyl-D-alanine ligase